MACVDIHEVRSEETGEILNARTMREINDDCVNTQMERQIDLLGHYGLGAKSHVLELAIAIDEAFLQASMIVDVPES